MPRLLLKITAAICAIILSAIQLSARETAIKSNLLYDATATLNVGVETGIAPQWSVDVSANLNAWKFGHRSWRHVMIQPECRYWLVGTMGGHFLAANVLVGYYNAGHFDSPLGFLGWHWEYLNDHIFEGWAYGFGVGYGYSFMINRHWNLELEATLGYINTNYDRWEVKGHKYDGHHTRNYFGPTKLAVTMSYIF